MTVKKTNHVFCLIHAAYDMNTYIFKVSVFTEQASIMVKCVGVVLRVVVCGVVLVVVCCVVFLFLLCLCVRPVSLLTEQAKYESNRVLFSKLRVSST